MSLHSDKGWLFVAFRLGGRQVRLYLGWRDTRANRRVALKGICALIDLREWEKLATMFPDCKHLTPYLPAGPDTTTFRQAVTRFLEYQANANKPATVEFYRRIIETHITGADLCANTASPGSASIAAKSTATSPQTALSAGSPTRTNQSKNRLKNEGLFADKPIRLIGASDIAALYAPVAQRGHQAQAANIRRVVSAVFQWARGERGSDGEYLVGDNPVSRTRRIDRTPRADRDGARGGEVDPFTSEEITAIIAGCRPGWERRLVIVAFETGVRPNELFGLKRKDIEIAGEGFGGFGQHRRQSFDRAHPSIDPSSAFIQIRQTYSRFGVGEVKTRGSRRSVPLSDAAVRALREQLAEVELRSVWLWPSSEVGAGWTKRGGESCHPSGNPTNPGGIGSLRDLPHNPQNFSKRNWPAILKRAGVEHRDFLHCRHTYAMRLLAEGVPLPEIAKRMGHTNLQMLIDHYLRWAPEKTEKKVRR